MLHGAADPRPYTTSLHAVPYLQTKWATPAVSPVGTPQTTSTTPKHTPRSGQKQAHRRAQTDFLSAATAKALTMVLAGLALTMTSLPKISFLPAFVAGFRRVLIMHNPGIVTFPVFFTSCVATLARVSRTLVTADFFSSVPSARACAKAPLVMGLPPFIAFIGAMALSSGARPNQRMILCGNPM